MPISQSHELAGVYKRNNLDAVFDVVYGAAHGGDAFYAPERLALTLEFIKKHLKSEQ